MKLKVSRPVVYVGLAAVGVAAWVLTAEEAPKGSSERRPVSSAKKNGEAFLAEDYRASFPPVSEPAKNAFRPLVVRSGLSDAGLSLPPNAIPLDFAGGEPNWIFTGVAIIDGAPVALFENSSTQEGVFVKHGDRWKSSTVVRITPETVVLAGPAGVTRTLKIVDTFENIASVPIQPLDVRPAVERAFGGEIVVTPEAYIPEDGNER